MHAKKSLIPHSITIEGECFVNDSVKFESLSLRDNSTLVIPKSVCVKLGTSLGGKVPVFGLLKRGGRVYTKIIPDASGSTLISIIESKVVPDSIVYSDCWKGYNVLDVSEFKHYRINHSKLFADKQNHINGIENFWNQAKRHMRKFKGIPRQNLSYF